MLSNFLQLLLGYLPLDRSQWEKTLQRKRAEYEQFCEDLVVDPKRFSAPGGQRVAPGSQPNPLLLNGTEHSLEGSLQRVTITHDDHPLSQGTNSRWQEYFKDSELLEQIDRDVMRTHPDMHFFSGSSTAAEQHRKVRGRGREVLQGILPKTPVTAGMTRRANW